MWELQGQVVDNEVSDVCSTKSEVLREEEGEMPGSGCEEYGLQSTEAFQAFLTKRTRWKITSNMGIQWTWQCRRVLSLSLQFYPTERKFLWSSCPLARNRTQFRSDGIRLNKRILKQLVFVRVLITRTWKYFFKKIWKTLKFKDFSAM